jgi:hypothetical protein
VDKEQGYSSCGALKVRTSLASGVQFHEMTKGMVSGLTCMVQMIKNMGHPVARLSKRKYSIKVCWKV